MHNTDPPQLDVLSFFLILFESLSLEGIVYTKYLYLKKKHE